MWAFWTVKIFWLEICSLNKQEETYLAIISTNTMEDKNPQGIILPHPSEWQAHYMECGIYEMIIFDGLDVHGFQ